MRISGFLETSIHFPSGYGPECHGWDESLRADSIVSPAPSCCTPARGVLGWSLGAMWIRAIQGVHKHQLDLVELALKQQGLSKNALTPPVLVATGAATPRP